MSLRNLPPAAPRRHLLQLLAVGVLGASLPTARADSAQRAAALLAGMDRATTIQQGTGRRRLYVFFDPNCPYCHHLYLALRPLLAAQDLQVHWVVLGIVTPTSEAKAAAMLQAPNRLKAFEVNENDYDFAAGGQPGGGIEPAASIAPATRAQLERNLQLYRSQKLFGVPVLVWKRRDGTAEMFAGVPSAQQLAGLLRDLA